MPQRNSLSKGAEARLGKTYLAKNKKFIMFHMSMSSREVRDLVGSPRASQAEQTWVLCAIAMPCPMPTPSFQSREAEAVDLKEGWACAGSLASTAQLYLVVLRKDFMDHGVRLGDMNN